MLLFSNFLFSKNSYKGAKFLGLANNNINFLNFSVFKLDFNIIIKIFSYCNQWTIYSLIIINVLTKFL